MLRLMFISVPAVGFVGIVLFFLNGGTVLIDPVSTPVSMRQRWAKEKGSLVHALQVNNDKSKVIGDLKVKDAWVEWMLEPRTVFQAFQSPAKKGVAVVVVTQSSEVTGLNIRFASAISEFDVRSTMKADFGTLAGEDLVHYCWLEPEPPVTVELELRGTSKKNGVAQVGLLTLDRN